MEVSVNVSTGPGKIMVSEYSPTLPSYGTWFLLNFCSHKEGTHNMRMLRICASCVSVLCSTSYLPARKSLIRTVYNQLAQNITLMVLAYTLSANLVMKEILRLLDCQLPPLYAREGRGSCE